MITTQVEETDVVMSNHPFQITERVIPQKHYNLMPYFGHDLSASVKNTPGCHLLCALMHVIKSVQKSVYKHQYDSVIQYATECSEL